MFVVHLCMYLCVYLSQAVSFSPTLGIKWDLYWHVYLAEKDQFEPAEVSSPTLLSILLSKQTTSIAAFDAGLASSMIIDSPSISFRISHFNDDLRRFCSNI